MEYTRPCGCIIKVLNDTLGLLEFKECPMHKAAPDIYAALKDIKKYVVGLDAFGPNTGQVIAGKCFLALAKAEGK